MLNDEFPRSAIRWGVDYHREWDDAPDCYVEAGLVSWGRSRRLGMLVLAPFKAYVGVQHIDPDRPGWGIVETPEARFFLSLFVEGRCVSLRTFQNMGQTLNALAAFLRAG